MKIQHQHQYQYHSGKIKLGMGTLYSRIRIQIKLKSRNQIRSNFIENYKLMTLDTSKGWKDISLCHLVGKYGGNVKKIN